MTGYMFISYLRSKQQKNRPASPATVNYMMFIKLPCCIYWIRINTLLKKNNTESKASDQSYSDYLELYIRFKLKVQAALDMKLDTLATQQAELRSFRNQVVESY